MLLDHEGARHHAGGDRRGLHLDVARAWAITLGLGTTFALLATILVLQIANKTYQPALFWTAIVATTTVGTEISDFLDRSLGLGYLRGSTILLSGLIASLAIWYAREGSLGFTPSFVGTLSCCSG